MGSQPDVTQICHPAYMVPGAPSELPAFSGPCLQHLLLGATCLNRAPEKDPVRPQLSSGLVPTEPAPHCPAPTSLPSKSPGAFSYREMNGLCLCPAQGPHPSAGKVAAKGGDLSRIAPAFLASWGSRGWVGSSFRSRRSFPTPRPQQSLRLHPHPQRQFQFTPSSSPWLSAEKSQKTS